MRTIEKQKRLFQLIIFAASTLLFYIQLYLFRSFWGNHFSLWIEGILAALLGVLTLIITEPFLCYLLFYIRKNHILPMRDPLRGFIKKYFDLNETQMAKLLLCLYELNGEKFVIKTTFIIYLKLLAAATFFSQRKWFATYKIPIKYWHSVAENSEEYFSTLQKSSIRKERIVIRPKNEMVGLQLTDSIVNETINKGIKLNLIATEDIEADMLNKLDGLEDFAFFDDEWVITAGDAPLNEASDDVSYELNKPITVMILRGNETLKYKHYRDALRSISKLKTFKAKRLANA